MVLATLALALQVAQASAPPSADGAYLIDSVTIVRVAPQQSAPVIATLKPLDVVMLYEKQSGWVHVSIPQRGGETPSHGWVKASSDNILKDTFLNSVRRLVKIRGSTWPIAVKSDVLRQRPRLGFTREQVSAALNEPLSQSSEESAAGIREIWLYPGLALTFKAGRLGAIKKVD